MDSTVNDVKSATAGIEAVSADVEATLADMEVTSTSQESATRDDGPAEEAMGTKKRRRSSSASSGVAKMIYRETPYFGPNSPAVEAMLQHFAGSDAGHRKLAFQFRIHFHLEASYLDLWKIRTETMLTVMTLQLTTSNLG